MPQNTAKCRTELDAKQEVFLLNYITSSTLTEACASSGISDDTARRWLKTPEIQERYAELRKQFLDEALSGLIGLTRSAIAALGRNLSDDSPPAVQVRAAQIILQQAIDLNKMSTLEEQIAELKALIERRI